MKVIDANTGAEVKIGEPFINVDGTHTLLAIDTGFCTARGLFRSKGHDFWVDLQVRYTHPAFFMQKVAFIPS